MTISPAALAALVLLALALGGAASFAWRGRGAETRLAAAEKRLREQQDEATRLEAARASAEARARAAEERAQHALRGAQDGVWEWQVRQDRVSLSPRWKGMLGYGPDDIGLTRADWLARVHVDDRPRLAAALERAVGGGGGGSGSSGGGGSSHNESRIELDLRLLHRDGSVRHVLSRGVLLRGEDGTPERLIGLDTDITRVKRVQAVLDAVADGTAGAFGERFFAAMVEHLARALEVDCAFITECTDQPATRVRTLAHWSVQRGQRESFEYDLAGTPCEEVVQAGRTCFHPERLAEKFPREAGWEAFVGMPIVASDGRVIGHLALMHRSRLGDEVLVERIYRIFLARAAAEIERMQAVAKLALQGGAPVTAA
ncbi:MAG: PAS domain-containing protein [Burkholderiales bacterium]|nr:PAS domain-containing protein [Burkholderiales bacterium]